MMAVLLLLASEAFACRAGAHAHPAPGAAPAGHRYQVPPDRVPPQGLCRIWYEALPPDRQPASMPCERAHRIAEHTGGRVITAHSPASFENGEVLALDYGWVDFNGVPPDRLPPPGTCRLWLEGVPPDRQPAPDRCRRVARMQEELGGRVLFMPG